MNTFNMIVYSGNNKNPAYLSKFSDEYDEVKSNDISQSFINHPLQSSTLVIIDDLLSFPYEWIKSSIINPVIVLNINESHLPEATHVYLHFISQYITPYDFIIDNNHIFNHSKIFEIIKNSSATLIEQDKVADVVSELKINNKTVVNSKDFFQFKELSTYENKYLYLTHEKTFSNVLDKILSSNVKANSRVIEISSRNMSYYQKHIYQKNWNLDFFSNKNDSLSNMITENIDEKYKIGILAFQYQHQGEINYRLMIEHISKRLISGGYLIVLDDFLLPHKHSEGLSLDFWQQIFVESSCSQLSFEHFELIHYKNICSEITSACFLLRKLGHN